jgi:hypothetical protein
MAIARQWSRSPNIFSSRTHQVDALASVSRRRYLSKNHRCFPSVTEASHAVSCQQPRGLTTGLHEPPIQRGSELHLCERGAISQSAWYPESAELRQHPYTPVDPQSRNPYGKLPSFIPVSRQCSCCTAAESPCDTSCIAEPLLNYLQSHPNPPQIARLGLVDGGDLHAHTAPKV